MATIEFTDPRPVSRTGRRTRVLAQAAVSADVAASIVRNRHWRWRVADDGAQLRADRLRSSPTANPRCVLLSCGVALDHFRVALAGVGAAVDVARMPEPGDPELLAVVRLISFGPVEPAAVRAQQAMALRGTERRMASHGEVPAKATRRLRAAAAAAGVRLRLLSPGYAVLCTKTDTPSDWLAAGEALSAVLLAASMQRLIAAPTDAAPDPDPGLLVDGARFRHPVIGIRFGPPGDVLPGPLPEIEPR